MAKKLNSELLIKARIWNNESLELIDFNNYDYEEFQMKIQTSGSLSRINKTVTFTKGENIEKTPFELFSINHNDFNGYFHINCSKPPKELIKLIEKNSLFIVYKGNKYKNLDNISQKYYKLSQGDIIKIGRIYFKVLDYKINEQAKTKNNKFDTDINNTYNSKASIIRSSSFRSAIVNGQEVIHGIFSPSNKKKDKNFIQLINSKNTNNYNKINIFAGKHILTDRSGKNILPLIFKNTLQLNRNNSAIEDLLLSNRNSKKIKTNRNFYDFNARKEKEIKLSLLNHKNFNFKEKNNKNKKPRACRICYGKETSIENPLICPCTCKGSMKYIHYQCLRNWLNSKIEADLSINSEIEEEIGITYCCKELSCELCKSKFPDYINHNGKIYNISFYEPKFKEFIILESMRCDKFKTKFIHILSFDNKTQIVLGRANECELSIPELSVSRYHCYIHKDKNKLYLEDNNSKFGSLILLQNPNLLIIDNAPLRLQKGRTYIKIKLIIPSSRFSCCNINTFDSKIFSYQVQNQKYFDIISSLVIKEDNYDISDDDNDDEEKNEENEIIFIKNNEVTTGRVNEQKSMGNIKKIKIKDKIKTNKELININKDKIVVYSSNSQLMDNGLSTTKNNNLNLINLNNGQKINSNNKDKSELLINKNNNIIINKNIIDSYSEKKDIFPMTDKINLIENENKNNIKNLSENIYKPQNSDSINLIDESKNNNSIID